ncbi:MAG: DUF1015 domain-containing protein [Candidatus Omnitrophica bacterium]|nr:DUF1015 domain-containing protein [Candidatus Omnitrophota bacterium]
MAEIIPFKGTLYNNRLIKDISKVVAPPYDVISPEEQDGFYSQEPHNIIRILLGRDFPDDNEKENKYTRAARFLEDWQKKGVLEKDKSGAIYIYLQEFTVDGKRMHRLGFIALLKLEDFDTHTSSVFPHENTLSAPKEDRTRLLGAIHANLGPVFAIFSDEDKSIGDILEPETKTQPLIDIEDSHGIRNKLWRISDRDTLETIVRLMKDKKLFIADGHHRYEVGLQFSKIKKDPGCGYILTYFTDLYADGVVILPVHRLISGVTDEVWSGLEKDLKKDFTIEGFLPKEHVKVFLSRATQFEKRFVVYDGHRFIGLILNSNDSLDITALHNLVIDPLRKKAKLNGGKFLIDFTKDLDYAVREVKSGKFSLSVLLNPIKITQIRDVAFSGRRMPQKSTYFYPKVLTGLVINVF